MKRNISIILGLLLLGVLRADAEVPAVARATGLPVYRYDSVEIALERTACFGTCPAYSVEICGDGRIWYGGEAAVPGTFRSLRTSISRAELRTLMNSFVRARFFEMPDDYFETPMVWDFGEEFMISATTTTDLPQTTLRIRMGERVKEVHLYENIPDHLWRLASAIDELVGIADRTESNTR